MKAMTMPTRLFALVLTMTMTTALASGAAGAAPAVQLVPPGQRLAATCAACHGSEGVTLGDALPSLAGQPADRLLASLRAFRDGSRPSTIMRQIVNGYSEAQLAAIAAYLAAGKGAR